MEPFDVLDSGRMAVLTDPEGAAFFVWQAKDQKGAQVVNEHGSLNFNGLATRDPEGAKAFYAAVFGWEVLTLPAGAMWTLPGYGEHLEERSPGLREQMAQMGAPEGFIDVVAALNPISDDDPDTPAHWSVTFAVDDADTAAAKARARWRDRRPTGRSAMDEDGGDQGPAGSDVHRQPVRPREQGPRDVGWVEGPK